MSHEIKCGNLKAKLSFYTDVKFITVVPWWHHHISSLQEDYIYNSEYWRKKPLHVGQSHSLSHTHKGERIPRCVVYQGKGSARRLLEEKRCTKSACLIEAYNWKRALSNQTCQRKKYYWYQLMTFHRLAFIISVLYSNKNNKLILTFLGKFS